MSSSPSTPPVSFQPHVSISNLDFALLDILADDSEPLHPKDRYRRRDAALDPLLMAAAVASGPHVTRHHYHHNFYPPYDDDEPVWDWSNWKGDQQEMPQRYVSKQAPRSERLKRAEEVHTDLLDPRPSVSQDATPPLSPSSSTSDLVAPIDSFPLHADVDVKCMVRARIPTPHGPAFLHLYHNDRDSKEHLAIVIDPVQLADSDAASPPAAPYIRSRSLDAAWSESESEMDRITRGAYVGRLSETAHRASSPFSPNTIPYHTNATPAPLVRIHSECFTGETIGSLRCDCGEQLDEAIRQISQPITTDTGATIPGRGAVVYMRQEGRGIGLLSKLRAYNLQDLGHDTVAANLLLGHRADERGYEVAAAILRDLGLDGHDADRDGDGIRLLTNNPDKVSALEAEGVRIAQRVPMVPRTWRCQDEPHGGEDANEEQREARREGVTLIGGGVTHSEELEKYLRTKVLRMGHMLSLPLSDETAEV